VKDKHDPGTLDLEEWIDVHFERAGVSNKEDKQPSGCPCGVGEPQTSGAESKTGN